MENPTVSAFSPSRAEQLMLGMAAMPRPLPQGIDSLLPGQREWQFEVLLRGLRP